MRTHEEIDRRSLELARAVVATIDSDPAQGGLALARSNCERWSADNPTLAVAEWREILKRPWHEIRLILLEDTEEARRRRQSSPFAGVLPPRERWAIYERFADDARSA